MKKRHIEQIELTDNFTTDLDTSLIDEILHDERKETVQKALDLLPEIQREVVILRYYHDLKYCKAYISVLGDEEAAKATVEGLRSASSYVRRELARRVNLRNTPEIKFILDQSIEYGVNMSKLIDEVTKDLHDEDEEGL